MDKEDSRQGQILAEFVRLNEKKERLHSRIGNLFDRLQDLLRKPEPTPTTGGIAKDVLTAQFAIDLSSISSTIETDLEKIDDILDRLEL